MPRGRLNERYVQGVAVIWLTGQLRQRAEVESVVGKMEVRVRSSTGLGWGRADGLVAATLKNGAIHVASIEAKSSRTLFNVEHRYRDNAWFLHGVAVALVALLVAGVVGWFVGHWFFQWALPTILFFLVAIGYLVATAEHQRYQESDVLNQVKRYPANEQWIALSSDAYNLLGSDRQGKLHAGCKHSGTGLIRVSSAGKVKTLESAVRRPSPRDRIDYLTCYHREAMIRSELLAQACQNSAADVVVAL